MDTQGLIDYYSGLLIRQYLGLPKATKNIEAIVGPLLVPQGHDVLTDNEGDPLTDNEGNLLFSNTFEPIIPLAIAQAFNIDTAIGNQLLIVGKYVGVTNSGQNFSGFVTLTDDEFRQLIKIMSVRNILKGTTFAINNFITEFFSGQLQVFDDLNKHITYYFSVPFGSDNVLEIFMMSGLLPKPLGVNMDIVAFGYDYFGFLEDTNGDTFGDVNDPAVGGFMPELIYINPINFIRYNYFGFLEDPNGDTFGDVNDPTVGGFMPGPNLN